jgi:hypothetical protein
MQPVRRLLLSLFALAVLIGVAGDARAAAVQEPRGLAVVARGDALNPAWTLARAVYADPGLLPPGLDEARARLLVGEPVPPNAPKDQVDLAETRAAIRGDDAPSRSLLQAIASSLHVKGIVVVEQDPAGPAAARVFVAETGSFDTVVYQPDPSAPVTWGTGSSLTTWSSAVGALHRGFADVLVTPPLPPAISQAIGAAPALGVSNQAAAEDDKAKGKSRPFYLSPWFWGAIGAAAFVGAAFFFATRDSSDPSISLQVQVPK